MQFNFVRLLCCAMVGTTVFGIETTFAQSNGSPRARSKIYAYHNAENTRDLYVAILGEVVQPGTYHLDPSEMSLQAVVKRAGGLTNDANQVIRVVRQGRIIQETLSEHETSRVLQGDVLIADAKFANQQSGRMLQAESPREYTTVHANYLERAERAGVQVAVINALEYPVVLTLRPEEATAVNIIDYLGQSSQILSNTRLISTDIATRANDSSKFMIRLTGGAAVHFDRGAVDRSRLPESLPRPIESAISLGAQSGLIGSPFGQSAELRNLGQRLNTGPTELFDSSSPQQAIRLPDEVSAPQESTAVSTDFPSDFNAPSLVSRPKIAVVPFTGTTPFATSSNIQSTNEPLYSEPIPQPDEKTAQLEQAPAVPEETISLDEETEQPTPSNRVPLFASLLLVVGALGGAAVIFQRQSQMKLHSRTPSIRPPHVEEVNSVETVIVAQPAPEPVRKAKPLLELLIKNEVPVQIEPVVFSEGLVLQGQIAEQPILRVDPPQNALKDNGPHFTPAHDENDVYALQPVVSKVDAPEATSIRRPHFLKTHAETEPQTASVAQQADVSPRSTKVRSDSPLANALLELEQGGRS